jgi:hypothetical protein
MERDKMARLRQYFGTTAFIGSGHLSNSLELL